MEKKYALFLGCTIPLRGRQYEKSAVEIGRFFGAELEPQQDFACCGFPIKSATREGTLLLAARNLAVAEEAGLEVLGLCSSCVSVLAEAAEELAGDDDLRARVNEKLAKVNRKIETPPRVRHPSLASPPKTARVTKPERPPKPARVEPPKPAAPPPVKEFGLLQVNSKPWTKIAVDGRDTGLTTPQLRIRLAVGKHKVTLSNSKFNINKTFTVTIRTDRPTRLVEKFLQQ